MEPTSLATGMEFFDKLTDKFFIRLLIDFVFVFILVRLVYFPIYKKKDYFFTFFIFNILIFIITYLLNKADLSMGAAFGLFAVFSMLRYRTEGISIKDMSYLFIVIAMGMISAVLKGTYFEMAILMSIIIVITYALEGNLFMKNEMVQDIQYENIDNIKPEKRDLLIADLQERTGLKIHKISITEIDFLKDTALVKIYYYE